MSKIDSYLQAALKKLKKSLRLRQLNCTLSTLKTHGTTQTQNTNWQTKM